jgi:hypothetical protein
MIYNEYFFIIISIILGVLEFIKKCDFVWKKRPESGGGRDLQPAHYKSGSADRITRIACAEICSRETT